METELSDEVESYLSLLIQRKIERGIDPQEARRLALIEFGGTEQIKERVREVSMGHYLETLLQDIRYAARILKKKPLFTLIITITLALGIGANTAIFSICDAVLFRSLPFPDSNHLVNIWESEVKHIHQPKAFSSYRDFHEWETNNHTFEKIAAYTWATGGKTLTGLGDAQPVLTIPVTKDFFSLLGVQPMLGRTLVPDDFKTGEAVVLSHRLWQTTFGGSKDILNKNITLSGKTYTVVGVMPSSFQMYPAQTDIWYPMGADNTLATNPKQHLLAIVGRIKPGVPFSAAEQDLVSIRQNVDQSDHDGWPEVGVVLNGLQDEYTWLAGRNLKSGLLAILAAVSFVLLIACVNVANLQLGRAAERKKEMAIRTALGSGRRRLIGQLLTESIMLSAIGALFGIGLAKLLIIWFVATHPIELPPGNQVEFDLRVLGFTIGLTIIVGLLSGIVPALQASRIDLNEALKESSRGNSRSALSHISGRIMIIAEVGLALMLLIGASLLIETVIQLRDVPLGFRTENLLTTYISLPKTSYSKPEQSVIFFDNLIDRIKAIPGVVAATADNATPPRSPGGQSPLFVEGKPIPPPTDFIFDVGEQHVFADFFETMGIPLLEGRSFTIQDRPESEHVVVINAALAKRYFPGEDPVGKRIKVGDSPEKEEWRTIVGVVANTEYTTVFKEMGFEEPPITYYPFAQNPSSTMNLFVRTKAATGNVAGAIRKEIRYLDSTLGISEFQTMDEIESDSIAEPRFRAVLVGGFAGLALLLATVGIYGVLSQSVGQRFQEIGIRMALGADRVAILKLVIWQGLKVIVIGVIAGVAGALAVSRIISGLLYDVRPTDPTTFASVSLFLMIVAVLACYIPARKAMKVDPMIALRYE